MAEEQSTNEVYLRLRRIYCVKGAEFCRPDLEAGWKEIMRLENENTRLRAEVQRLKAANGTDDAGEETEESRDGGCNMSSEFGSGFVYPLSLFIAHKHLHEDWPIQSWMSGAADHIFELKIPKCFTRGEKRRVKVFVDKIMTWRLDSRMTVDEKVWALNEATELMMIADRHMGLSPIEAEWE